MTMPVPMMNILNGGAHAANNVDVQEFMIMPVGASSFSEGLRWCAEVYHTLASVLRQNRLETAVGDEGGFAPDLAGEEEAISLILHAIEGACYQPGRDFMLALDAAASEWKGCAGGCYRLPKSGKEYDSASLTAHWKKLCSQYPIASLEDPLDEEDWDGWSMLTDTLGGSVQLVGDDLFVTSSGIPPLLPIAPAKRRTPPLPIWRLPATRDKSRPAHPVAASVSPNITGCCALRKRWEE